MWQRFNDTIVEGYKNVICKDIKTIYFEIGDCKEYIEGCFVSNIFYIASQNGRWVSNVLQCLYTDKDNNYKMIDGSFVFSSNYRIKKMKVIMDICNLPLLRIRTNLLITCCNSDNDFIVLRLNSNLDIYSLKINGHIADYLRISKINNIIMICNTKDDFINNECEIDIEYSGYPDFQEPSNYINKNSINISYESNIFPIINFLPIDTYEFICEYKHPLNSVVCAAGKVKTITKNRYCNVSIYESTIETHCNCLILGEYRYLIRQCQNIDICIFYTESFSNDIDKLADIIVDCFNHYSLLLDFYPPYKTINICIDDKLIKTSYAQSNLICLANDQIDTISHEIAHLWWGCYVTGVGPGWCWFHEAFAEIFSMMYTGKINSIKKEMVAELRYKDILNTSFLGSTSKCINKFVSIVNNIGEKDFLRYCKKVLIKKYISIKELNEIFDNKLFDNQ